MKELYNRNIFENIKFALDSPQCPGLQDNERRMEFILKIINLKRMGPFLSDVSVVEKNAATSCEFRLRGNSFFTSSEGRSLNKAIEEYTKSVAHAPTGSQELALAYANRSAVLFKARLISDCLLDIQRALENNYPDNLKAKLYLRKAMCLQILNSRNDSTIKTAFAEARKWTKKMNEKNQKIMKEMLTEHEKSTSIIDKSTFTKWNNEKSLPKLSAENSMIPGLSDAAELRYSEKYGRHVVATRDIEPGEVIAVQKAYAEAVLIASRYKICWNCGEQTWASIPCETCVEVIFCSEICRENAMLEHHEIECPVVASLIALEWTNAELMPLKIIVKALKEMNNSFEAWRESIERIDAEKNPLLKGFTNNVLEPNNFSSVYVLSGHALTEFIEEDIGDSIVIAFLLATKTRYFGSKFTDDLGVLSSEKNFVFVVGLLEKVLHLLRINCLYNPIGDMKQCLVVPALSFFNHSCNSMVTVTDHNGYLASRALRQIKRGQQIFFTYGYDYIAAPKHKRQTGLLSVFKFLCDCEACENNWQQNHEGKSGYQKCKNTNPFVLEVFPLIYHISTRLSQMKTPKDADFDVKEKIVFVVTALKIFYSLDCHPNSLEIFVAERALCGLLHLTKNRFLLLD